MKVRYTPEALADLAAIYDYLDERSPRVALRTKAALQRVIAGLTDFPDMGPATDIEDVRVLLAGRLPYRIFYRHVGEAVHVLHIRHTSRRPWQEDRDS